MNISTIRIFPGFCSSTCIRSCSRCIVEIEDLRRWPRECMNALCCAWLWLSWLHSALVVDAGWDHHLRRLKLCWTKQPKKALAKVDNIVCMNTRWQCTPLEADGWEMVSIVEFISAIIDALIDLFFLSYLLSVSARICTKVRDDFGILT